MKKFLLIIFSIFLSFSLFAFDFGGSVQNDFSGRFISSKINLDDKVDVSFWFKMPLDFQGNTTLNFETAYIGDFVQKIGFSNYFDIRKLNIKMRIPLSTSWNCIFLMGRQNFSDISTQIYDGKLDQLSFDFNFDFVKFNILAGYTGLLNGYTHNTFVPVEYFDKDKFYIQNKIPAVIFDGKITLNKLFNFSPISLEFLNISVLQPENQNNLYINLQLNRELTEFHSFNVFTSFLFNNKNENKIANFTKAHFSYKKENDYANFLNGILSIIKSKGYNFLCGFEVLIISLYNISLLWSRTLDILSFLLFFFNLYSFFISHFINCFSFV